MRIAQAPTACDAFHAHSDNGLSGGQRSKIIHFIETSGGSWSIGELDAEKHGQRPSE